MRNFWIICIFLCSLAGAGADSSWASPDGPVASSACNALCAGVPDATEYAGRDEQERWAACFSCRCKESIGWLPSPEELKCSTGTELERYRARTEGAGPDGRPLVVGLDKLDPHGEDTSGCLNGGIAAAGCDLLARFKRITHEQHEFQLLCRRPSLASTGYYEYLIIGNNTQTGATCFWQARNSSFDGENVPSLDVNDAQRRPVAEKVERYVDTFYSYSAGPSTCTSCHASDAFIWSPYFHSAYPVPNLQDPLVRARLTGPYYQVSAASERLQSVNHRFLTHGPATTAADAPPTPVGCTGCHRIADGSFCSSFSWQALGESDRAGTQDLDPASAFQRGRALMYWMPPTSDTHPVWAARAAADMNRLRACCDASHPACRWSEGF